MLLLKKIDFSNLAIESKFAVKVSNMSLLSSSEMFY